MPRFFPLKTQLLRLPLWMLAELALAGSSANAAPTTYAEWAAASFTAAEIASQTTSGPEADPAGCGVANLTRYAMGLPARGAVVAPVTAQVLAAGGGTCAALQFSRSAVATDVHYVVQASADLQTWRDLSTWRPGSPTTVAARDDLPMDGSERRFLRLKVGSGAAPFRVLVPAYFYPVGGASDYWVKMTAAAAKAPAGTIYAIANLNNGPVSPYDADRVSYLAAISAFRAAGGRVLGYVSTERGARAAGVVKTDIDLWYSIFGVDGIFLDEQATGSDMLTYYSSLRAHIKAKGGEALVVANPGTTTIEAYLALNDVTCVFENVGPDYFPSWSPATWAANYPASKFYVLPYSCTESQMRGYVSRAAANNVGWIYVTNDNGTNPWDTLPSYFGALVDAALAGK